MAKQDPTWDELETRYAEQSAWEAANGRITIEEAARRIGESGEEREDDAREKLEQAALEGTLPMYPPGATGRYLNLRMADGRPRIRTFSSYLRCYVEDLNQWLEENEPRIQFRFGGAAHEATALVSTGTRRIRKLSQDDRRDTYWPVIEQAQSQCRNKYDAAEVWPRLVELAESDDPPPPLVGVMSDGRLKFKPRGSANAKPGYMNIEALKKRLRRQKERDESK